MKKWSGTYTEFGNNSDEFRLTECTSLIDDAKITQTRIAIDWTEPDGKYLAVLVPELEGEMEIWRGRIQCSVHPRERGRMDAVRYNLKGGGILLVVKWVANGYEGAGMYELFES